MLRRSDHLLQEARDTRAWAHSLAPSASVPRAHILPYLVGSVLLSTPQRTPGSPQYMRPEDAQTQSFSILVHAFVQTKRLASARFSKDIQRLLDEVQTRLSCKWWQGLPNRDERTAMNIHLSTKEGEPLTP